MLCVAGVGMGGGIGGLGKDGEGRCLIHNMFWKWSSGMGVYGTHDTVFTRYWTRVELRPSAVKISHFDRLQIIAGALVDVCLKFVLL